MVSCHTRGQWYGTVEELGRHIRPVFRKLVSAAVATGLGISVVSFSCQAQLIKGALASALPAIDTSSFVIRCSDKRWDVSETAMASLFPGAHKSSPGKLTHIYSAAQQMCLVDKENGLRIRPEDIVLIDDDVQNVQNALENRVTAVLMDPEAPDAFLDSLSERYLADTFKAKCTV